MFKKYRHLFDEEGTWDALYEAYLEYGFDEDNDDVNIASGRSDREPPLDDEEWPELEYHLSRIETGNMDSKKESLKAISFGIGRRPAVPRRDFVSRLVKFYNDTEDEELRAY